MQTEREGARGPPTAHRKEETGYRNLTGGFLTIKNENISHQSHAAKEKKKSDKMGSESGERGH